eukprot:267799-Prymnesium_polylepis.1
MRTSASTTAVVSHSGQACRTARPCLSRMGGACPGRVGCGCGGPVGGEVLWAEKSSAGRSAWMA